MRYLIIAAAASAAYLAYVALLPQYREDPSTDQVKGWRSCLSEEAVADSCTADIFPTLAACQAFNASDPYAIMDDAECFENIDEVPISQGGYAVDTGE